MRRNIVLVSLVCTLGGVGSVIALAIDALYLVLALSCPVLLLPCRSATCSEQGVILGHVGLAASGAQLMAEATPGSTMVPFPAFLTLWNELSLSSVFYFNKLSSNMIYFVD